MKLQPDDWSCGAYSVVNALRSIGIKTHPREVIPVSGTRKDAGTSEQGIIRAVRHFGGIVEEYASSKKRQAWTWLHGSLVRGCPVILCLDSWDHWVSVVGALGERVVLMDSGPKPSNVRELGLHVLAKRTVMTRWWNGRPWVEREGFDHHLYAIQVRKRK